MPATDRPARTLVAVSTLACLAAVTVRARLDRTPLWLDEAQTIAIARLDVGSMFDALAQDGHPPLYYLVLHGWIEAFGTSDAALRSLSAVFGVGVVCVLAVIAGRRWGRSAGIVAAAIAATNPFLIRYATEVRMYALVTLAAGLWWLAVGAASRQPTPGRLAAVAATVSVLVLSHYWSFFLLGAWGLWMVLTGQLGDRIGRLLLASHVVGSSLFVGWLPVFLDQMGSTGTPWAAAPNPASVVVTTAADLAGGRDDGAALALMVLLGALVLLGLTARPIGPHRLELDLRMLPALRPLAFVTAGTLVLGIVVITATDSAFASRYAAVLVGFVLVIAARGLVQLDVGPASALLVVVCVLGLVGGLAAVDDDRTQGAQVAAAIAAAGTPGDVVVVCPDQLGPATVRELPVGFDAVSYPNLAPAERVDWTDYEQRHRDVSPSAVADAVVALADGSTVWLVWQDGYRTLEGQCSALRAELAGRLGAPTDVVASDPTVFEPMWLTTFSSSAT